MSFKKAFIAGICSVILIMPFSSVANVNNNSDIVTVKEFGKIEKTENGAVAEVGVSDIFDIVPFGTGSVKVTGSGESYVGGGKWTYGLSSTNLWSRYVNNDRVHGTRVKNEYGVRESRAVRPGLHAIASIKKAKSGNYAYVYFN